MKHFRTILAILTLIVFSPLTHHAQESPSGALQVNDGYRLQEITNNTQFEIDTCLSSGVAYCIPGLPLPSACPIGDIPMFWPHHIINVRIGDIDNTSECGGYSCFADMSTSIEAGARYYAIITMAEIGRARDYQYLYYVDWNADGDFDDEGEGTSLGGGNSFFNMSFYIEVPDSVSPGEKRLRVAGFQEISDIEIDACRSEFPGEVEDYTLVVADPVSSIRSAATGSNVQLNIFPNPATDHIFVSGLLSQAMGELVIYASNGEVAYREKGIFTDQMRVNISNLNQGFYVVEVRTQGDIGWQKLIIAR